MILSQQFPKLRCIPRSAVANRFSQKGFTTRSRRHQNRGRHLSVPPTNYPLAGVSFRANSSPDEVIT